MRLLKMQSSNCHAIYSSLMNDEKNTLILYSVAGLFFALIPPICNIQNQTVKMLDGEANTKVLKIAKEKSLNLTATYLFCYKTF